MRFAFAIGLLVSMLAPNLLFAESNWNQFRGPGGDGQAGSPGLPLIFGEEQNVVWKIPIKGKGWSSPVVWGEQIWLTTAPEDGKKLYAVCVDFGSGKVVHNLLVFENEDPQFCHPMNSYATPTPVVEEGRVYVHFGTHGTACIDTQSGKTLWTRRDLECDHFRGPAASPIVHNDLLVMQFDGFDVQYVVALNKSDGTTAWKTSRAIDYNTDNGDRKKAYCTPTVVKLNGVEQLIAPAAVATEALDPQNGKRLWTVYHGGMNASARPLLFEDVLFITNGMGRMVAVEPKGKGDQSENILWESSKGVPKKSSLLLIDGMLYMVSDDGIASCVEPRSGKVIWSKRLPGREYAASPIYADGRIYCFSRDGAMPVLKPGPEFEMLAENQFDDGFMASPAVVGKSLVLRTVSHLYRVEQK